MYAVAPVALSMARLTTGRALPRAAAEFELNWSIEGAGSFGMTNVCPLVRGCMSKNAIIRLSSYTLWQGNSPLMIRVKIVGSSLIEIPQDFVICSAIAIIP